MGYSFGVRRHALLAVLLLAPTVVAQEPPVPPTPEEPPAPQAPQTPETPETPPAKSGAEPTIVERALAEISAEGVMAHLSVLASDDFGGREAGTKAGRLAANYVATQFRKAGCEPFGDDQSFFQAFTIEGRKVPARDCAAALIAGGRESGWVPELDFIPFGNAPLPDGSGPIVFAGYGITARRPAWDDYAELDVKGKIVLLLRGTPRRGAADDPFAGSAAITYGALSRKVATAARKGAVGVIVVRGPREGADAGDRLDAPVYRTQVPAINVKASVLDRALRSAGLSLATLEASAQPSPGAGARELPASARLRASFRTVDDLTHNVLGLVRGSDPALKDELVVIGGHYDHVGMGRFGSRSRSKGAIHNGADDNASGTSGVITIARTLKAIGYAPRRSILFMGFSAEEKGLLGSRYYVKHPKWPLDKTVAMINLDMIGRGPGGWCVACGVGTSPGFADMVTRLNGKVGLNL
ncbi:MAG: M20/M25/M40 family metallo-hydrolase, partial [Planctomycetota bacterium]